MRRALLIVLAIPLVLVLAAVILLPLLLDKEKILELAAAEVHKQTGATLSVEGPLDLTIFPRLGVGLGDVTLLMPEQAEPLLRARALEIGVQVMPLLSKEVAIDSITLDGVDVHLVTEPAPEPLDTTKLSDAELRAFYEKRRVELEEAGQAAGAQAAIAVPLALNIASLSVTDTRLSISEVGSDEVTRVEIESLKASDLNLDGRPMPLRTTLRIPGETPLELELEGRFTLDQDSQQLGIEKLAADVDGALAETLKLEAVGTADVNRQIADLELQIGSADMRGEGTLRYASFESPQIDTKLHLNRFSRALLAVAGPGAAQAEPEPESGDGDTPLPLNALRAIDTQADLSIDEIDLEGHKLLEFKALLRVKDGLAALNRVTGTLHGGELSMHANLNARQSVAALNTKGGLKGVDLAQAMAAAGVEPSATGRASLTWELHGKGNTVNALRDTLRGPLDLTTEQLVLTDLGIEQKLCSAVALVNQERLTAKFPATSSFKDLSAKVAMGGGKAQLQPLNAQLSNITLTGKGELDLASLDFDTVFKARLLPGLEELDPACRINERITSVKWPVKCKGNASGDPADWCSVDSGDIIEDLAEYELKRKASKELEDKLGDKADGLLKGLLGK